MLWALRWLSNRTHGVAWTGLRAPLPARVGLTWGSPPHLIFRLCPSGPTRTGRMSEPTRPDRAPESRGHGQSYMVQSAGCRCWGSVSPITRTPSPPLTHTGPQAQQPAKGAALPGYGSWGSIMLLLMAQAWLGGRARAALSPPWRDLSDDDGISQDVPCQQPHGGNLALSLSVTPQP